MSKKKRISLKCEYCNKDFEKTPSQLKVKKHHFCSRDCSGKFSRKDFTGQTFDSLYVISLDLTSKNRSRFKCKCNKCNNIVYVLGNSLQTGGATKCIKCANRKYVGEVSGQYFSSLKRGARNRKSRINIPFEITQSDIWEKFLEQDRKCALSGIELVWTDGARGEKGTASVDRKDSNIGYTKNNIQIIHKDINRMKNNFIETYFIEMCHKISNNLKEITNG
jgi:hypothetical protein